jgi:hypothetical protein
MLEINTIKNCPRDLDIIGKSIYYILTNQWQIDEMDMFNKQPLKKWNYETVKKITPKITKQ